MYSTHVWLAKLSAFGHGAALWVMLALCGQAMAQNQAEPGVYPIDYDTNYIADYRHKLNLSLAARSKVDGFGILTPDNKVLTYFTNTPIPTSYGFMLSYRWLNAQLTMPIEGLSLIRPDRGETKNFALGIGAVARKWQISNVFELFEGYYMANPEVIFPGMEKGSTLVFDNMKSHSYYGEVNYTFSGTKFSYRNMYWQSELQKKSKGTFMMSIPFGFKNINSEDDLLPDPIEADLYHIRNLYTGLNVGIAYTLVLGNHINISLSFWPGINYTWGWYDVTGFKDLEEQQGLGTNSEVRFQFLFYHKRFYMGLGYSGFLQTNYIQADTPVGATNNSARFNLGYRFTMKPQRWLRPFRLSN